MKAKKTTSGKGTRRTWQPILRRCKAGALLLLLMWLQALPALCSHAKTGMPCCGGKICSAMRHRGSGGICHPAAKNPLQKTVMDCSMDCCKSTTHAIVVSGTFVLPDPPAVAYQVIADFLVPRSSIVFSGSAKMPDIPPPRTLFC